MDARLHRGNISQWWNAVGGPREVLHVAWPMMMSTGLFSLTLFVDRTLLYYYSDEAAAGAMGAGTIFWAFTCVPVTLFGYTSTFVAQYVGVGRADRAMRVVIQGFLLALLSGPLVVSCAWCSHWFFAAFHGSQLADTETQYFQSIALGAWATILSAPLAGLFNGTGRTRVLLGIDIVVTALNIALDFLLIFGLFGFPRMGIVGAGLATSISLVTKLVLMLVAAGTLRWDRASGAAVDRRATSNGGLNKTSKCGPMALATGSENTGNLSPCSREEPAASAMPLTASSGAANGVTLFSEPLRLEFRLATRLLYFGWPAAISSLAESVSFSIIMMLVGQLGARAMAATTLGLNVNLIAFIPMFGLGMAVGVLVGQRLTAKEPEIARRSVRSGLCIGGFYSGCFAVAYGIFPDWVLAIYSFGGDPDRFADLRPDVLPILWFIAAYCVFDAFQIVFVGALKGAGDTNYVLIVNVLSGVITVSLGKILGDIFNGGLLWWWGVITIWVLSMAVLFAIRYLHGGWMKKRVIEPELL
ncbi:MAG: MATE family efflux transporter [Pirellulaceae bacterium]|nr:MATE family efflux transporter [Pirellulaceae bacterium]